MHLIARQLFRSLVLALPALMWMRPCLALTQVGINFRRNGQDVQGQAIGRRGRIFQAISGPGVLSFGACRPGCSEPALDGQLAQLHPPSTSCPLTHPACETLADTSTVTTSIGGAAVDTVTIVCDVALSASSTFAAQCAYHDGLCE